MSGSVCACVRERVCVRELVGLTLILSIRALFRFWSR